MNTLAILRGRNGLRDFKPSATWLHAYIRLPLPPLSFYLMIVAYMVCNQINQQLARNPTDSRVLATALDLAIPFIPWLLPVYLAHFAFYCLPKPLLLGGVLQRRDYRMIQHCLLLGTLLSCGLFLAFPAVVDLREVAQHELARGAAPQWLTNACLGLFALDSTYNAWPSLHVSQPLLILLAMNKLRCYPVSMQRLHWVLYMATVLSVLGMKQHYVWDVVSGMGLSLLLWWAWLRPRLSLPLGVLGRGLESWR